MKIKNVLSGNPLDIIVNHTCGHIPMVIFSKAWLSFLLPIAKTIR